MATISFHSTGGSFAINNLSGSGLGFYGSTFGNSVAVGAYQTTTWITDSNGTVQGPQVENIKWTHPNSGSINGADSKALLDIPNHLATLRIRFNHSTAVKTQNEQLRIYDRSSISNDPSGVLCKVAEIAHPSTTQTGTLGSGDSSWKTPTGSSVVMTLGFSSPGQSGHRPNSTNTQDMNHDYHFALSSSPNSIGSKLFALYFQCEYL
jgi:hypothetical protein